MRRVLNFVSPREHYIADAAVVWCFDHRFEAASRKLLKRIGVFSADAIRVAGGAKSLASPEQESARLFVLDQLQKSIRLHKTRTVVLMLHSDCGAYGGLAAFHNDPEEEARHHAADLQRAASFVKQQIPELAIKSYFVDFDGVWEMEPAGKTDVVGAQASGEKV
ncbi:MAG TPA: carbonic anhydrase [Candidatus Angelobacter sp.]